MPIYRATITKQVSFRGKTEQFSNRYTLSNPTVVPETAALLAKLRDLEKPLYSTDVNFVEGRVWRHVPGNKQESKMLDLVRWEGQTGGVGTGNELYRELAIMCYWPLGRYGKFNRPQFLRKWHHVYRVAGLTANELTGSAAGLQSLSLFNTYIAAVEQFTTPGGLDGTYYLATEDDRRPVAPGKVYPYLEHRQFRN